MDYDGAAAAVHLELLGAAPDGDTTVLLLGPREPGFWADFIASPEYTDGAPEPMDRWSKRVIGALARDWQGEALFPSDGPPYPPFISWALASGAIWASPVTLLVHARQGLWTSFRGAIRVPGTVTHPTASQPCTSCENQPCRSACPVGALSEQGYDVAACHAFLDTLDGSVCLTKGCAVRRACPVGVKYGRHEDQSFFHMRAFHPG